MPAAYLPSRHLIRISGADAANFLHGLITTDIESLPEATARPGALLTPQGKILFDFMIWKDVDGSYLIETDVVQRDGLMRRLMMYKLRAAVEIAAAGEGVSVFWGEDSAAGMAQDAAFAAAGLALSRSAGQLADGNEDAYRALRISAGIPVSGEDFTLQDAFPHDVLLDKTDGLSFRKGCYVGQEVVSRMQHRGTARRRVALVTAQEPLPGAGAEIIANGKPAGTLGSAAGVQGLAIVRVDRIGSAIAAGTPVTIDGQPVEITLPGWSGLAFPEDAAQEAET